MRFHLLIFWITSLNSKGSKYVRWDENTFVEGDDLFDFFVVLPI